MYYHTALSRIVYVYQLLQGPMGIEGERGTPGLKGSKVRY